MKPPEETKRELAAQWLEKAEGDWCLSHRLASDPGEYPPVTTNDAASAVAVADHVRDQIRSRLPATHP